MNIKYHFAIGCIGEYLIPSSGLFLAFSVLPDSPLIYNEIKLLKTGRKFNPYEVDNVSFNTYMFFHSIWVNLLITYISIPFGIAHFIHIFTDWFTHTGRFASQPFYPISKYRIDFGKDILK